MHGNDRLLLMNLSNVHINHPYVYVPLVAVYYIKCVRCINYSVNAVQGSFGVLLCGRLGSCDKTKTLSEMSSWYAWKLYEYSLSKRFFFRLRHVAIR